MLVLAATDRLILKSYEPIIWLEGRAPQQQERAHLCSACFGCCAQFKTNKVIYRRYAGLYFSLCVDVTDNELAYLESIHLFVEILDHYFSNVCELDLVFNFHKARLSAFPEEPQARRSSSGLAMAHQCCNCTVWVCEQRPVYSRFT